MDAWEKQNSRLRFLIDLAYWTAILAIGYLGLKFLSVILPLLLSFAFAALVRPVSRFLSRETRYVKNEKGERVLVRRKVRMNRTVAGVLSVLVLFTPGHYPFQPIQLTLISSLTIGIPGFFLAMEPSRERVTGSFLRTILRRALPGGTAVAVCAVLAACLEAFGWPHTVCSTVATLTAGFLCYVVLFRNCLPLNGKRIALLAGIAAAAVITVLTLPGLFFLERMSGNAWIA